MSNVLIVKVGDDVYALPEEAREQYKLQGDALSQANGMLEGVESDVTGQASTRNICGIEVPVDENGRPTGSAVPYC